MRRRVVKLGGSLLDYERLRDALPEWLAQQPPACNVLIVGGGDLVETIRTLDRRLGIGELEAHWLCIRAMGVSAGLAKSLWPDFELVATWSELQQSLRHAKNGVAIFDVENFLRRDEPSAAGTILEHSWRVTSDSIAARVAATLAAHELVLLKSALPAQSPMTCREAAAAGYVDPFFFRAAESLAAIRAVDLRSPDFREAILAPEP